MTATVAANSNEQEEKPKSKKWVWAKRALTTFFFLLIPVLLFMVLKNIEWQDIKQAIHAYQLKTLLFGCLIATASFLVFSSYDLISLHYLKNPIKVREVLPLAYVGCVFALNLAWVGGVASRFRLYPRLGVDAVTIAKIISTNIITNWFGYTIVGGIIFTSGLLDLPDNWKMGNTALQLTGIGLLLIATAYLAACRFSKKRTFHFFKQEISLPNFKLALVQAGFASLNWCLMGLLIYTLLLGKISYPTVLGILLMCSIAGAVTHVPAGLGVIEAIFVAMLSHQLSKGTIIAALLGYRVIYFLLPLLIAALMYLVLEIRYKRKEKLEGEKQK